MMIDMVFMVMFISSNFIYKILIAHSKLLFLDNLSVEQNL